MKWKNWFKVTPLPYQTMNELNQWTDSTKMAAWVGSNSHVI
jgi:hypothetical protein